MKASTFWDWKNEEIGKITCQQVMKTSELALLNLLTNENQGLTDKPFIGFLLVTAHVVIAHFWRGLLGATLKSFYRIVWRVALTGKLTHQLRLARAAKPKGILLESGGTLFPLQIL